MTRISAGSFFDCKSLEHFDLPLNIIAIGGYAFKGCILFQEVNIAEGVETIDEGAFMDCKTLRHLTLPQEVRIGNHAFTGTALPDPIINKDKLLYIPDWFTAYSVPDGVKMIGKILGENSKLEILELAESVVNIENGAFRGATSLQHLNLPNVTCISKSLFKDCTNLVSVILGKGVKEIEDLAFCGCTALRQITIGNPRISISSNAFSSCTSIIDVQLPKGLGPSKIKRKFADSPWGNKMPELNTAHAKKVKTDALRKSSVEMLLRATIGDFQAKITQLDNRIVINSTTHDGGFIYAEIPYDTNESIMSIDLGPLKNFIEKAPGNGILSFFGIMVVPDEYFKGRKDIRGISFSKTIKRIGEKAFEGCTSLLKVEIPDTCVNIGKGVFENCVSLIEASVPCVNTALFKGCSALKKVNLPYSIEEIPIEFFNGCVSLEEFCVSPNVKKIGYEAFSNCKSLRKLVIPPSVKEIEGNLFSYRTHETRTLVIEWK